MLTAEKKYRRNQSIYRVLTELDNEFTRAAVNLVIAVDGGKYSENEDIKTLAEGIKIAFGTQPAKLVFGSSLGLVRPRGKPAAHGFTPADIVSAYIELWLRKFGNERGSLQRAHELARDAFVDVDKYDGGLRQIRRDWKNGKNTVKDLAGDDLEALLSPYEVP